MKNSNQETKKPTAERSMRVPPLLSILYLIIAIFFLGSSLQSQQDLILERISEQSETGVFQLETFYKPLNTVIKQPLLKVEGLSLKKIGISTVSLIYLGVFFFGLFLFNKQSAKSLFSSKQGYLLSSSILLLAVFSLLGNLNLLLLRALCLLPLLIHTFHLSLIHI